MRTMTRTNADIRATKQALDFLGNSASRSEKQKPQAYNALMLRIRMAIDAYTPLAKAIDETEKAMVERYVEDAGAEVKYGDNGSINFGPRLDREFMAEQRAFLEASAEDEPKRRAFTIADFDAVGINVPQIIQSQLGPLLATPAVDPDAITESVATAEGEE